MEDDEEKFDRLGLRSVSVRGRMSGTEGIEGRLVSKRTESPMVSRQISPSSRVPSEWAFSNVCSTRRLRGPEPRIACLPFSSSSSASTHSSSQSSCSPSSCGLSESRCSEMPVVKVDIGVTKDFGSIGRTETCAGNGLRLGMKRGCFG